MNIAENTICVVIVNFNGADCIVDCLDALLAQRRPADRVIVIDNASIDNSVALINAHQLKVELICNTQNIGFAAANNQAARLAANCKWLALLNPDTKANDDWLDVLELATGKHPQYPSFASLQLNMADPNVCDGAGDTYHAIGYAWRRAHNLPRSVLKEATEEVFSGCGAAWLLKRDTFLQLGGFDEDFFCYCEDVDLGFRLRLSGYATLFVPEAIVQHQASALSGLDSEFSIYHGQRNVMWVFLKNTPLPLFLLMLLPNLAFNLVGILRFLPTGKAGIALHAKYHALRALPEVLAKRRDIQGSMRTQSTRECLSWLQFSPFTLISRLRTSRQSS